MERVFLMYVLTAPVTDADTAFLANRLLESLGDGYRVETEIASPGARVQVFNAAGTRIADRRLLTHGIRSTPLA